MPALKTLFLLRRATLAFAVAGTFLIVGCNRAPQTDVATTSHLKHVTGAAFETEVTQSTRPVVVNFTATWCPPCRIQKPILDRLAAEYDGQVKFLLVDVDQEPALAGRFEVESIPMSLVFSQGRVVQKYIGVVAPEVLKERIETLPVAEPSRMN